MYPFRLGVFINPRENYASAQTLTDAIRFAAEQGAQGIQLYAFPELLEMDAQPNFRREIKSLCDSLGLTIASVCGDMGIKFHVTERMDELTELMKHVYDLAEGLGTDIVTTHVGVVPTDHAHPRYAIMQDAFGKIARIAESHRAYLANETGPELAYVLKDFLDGIGSPASAVNFDPANIIMSTNESPEEAVKILAPYIRHVHAKDGKFLKMSDLEVMYGVRRDASYRGSDYCRETIIGEGDICWTNFLQTLADTGYRGFLTIEREGSATHAQDVVKEIALLKNMLNA